MLCQLESKQQVQDFLKFDGNAQTFRLVATLQVLADYTGLNLTFGTLSALLKYVASSDEAGAKKEDWARRKAGYFASEKEIVKQVRDETGTGDARNPISYLVEAADDIVYLAADIEDAVKKGVLSWDEVKEELCQMNDHSVRAALEMQNTILKAGSPDVPIGLEDDIKAAAFRTGAIGVMVEATLNVFKAQYKTIMAGDYKGTLLRDSDAKGLADCLRHLGPGLSTACVV